MTLPTRQDRAWLAGVLGVPADRLRLRRLDGGITSSVHAIWAPDALGEPRQYVLRRWTECDPTADMGDVDREASILTGLETTELPAPHLIAADAAPEYCSAPSLLMTRVPGSPQLTPKDTESWLRQMAEMLPRIHAAPVEAPPLTLDHKEEHLRVPRWASDPGLWAAALELFGTPQPGGERCFIHSDYQQFNVLWTGAKLSGVVDWPWGSHGSPDVDVAHCRLNLTVLYSAEHASRFLSFYEHAAGRRVDPWWDVAGLLLYLPGWGDFLQRQAGRRLTVDFAGMHARMEQTMRQALART